MAFLISDLMEAQSFMVSIRHSSRALTATFRSSSIRPSDSLTYTKPRVMMSGPETTLPSSPDMETTTTIMPSSARCLRSRSTTLPTSPTP